MPDIFKRPEQSIFRIFTSRALYIVLALLLQLIFLLIIIMRFKEFSVYIEAFFVALSIGMVIWILNQKALSAYKIAWMIPILAFPVFGGIVYLLLGGSRTGKREQKRLQEIADNMNQSLRQNDLYADEAVRRLRTEDIEAGNQSAYLVTYTHLPPFRHTDTTYYATGEAFFEAMIRDLEQAKHFIFLEYFIIERGILWNRMLHILKMKANEGVDVRLIYDDIGTITRLPADYRNYLENFGIRCAVFAPFHPILTTRFNNRDHRKITVIDGRIAYTGGANLADEYINEIERFGHWKDNGIRLVGPAATSFTLLFLSMWDYLTHEDTNTSDFILQDFPVNHSAGVVQPFGDSPLDGEAISEAVYRNMIGQAKESVYILTPYLVISDELESTISLAAKRGVSVHIITPHQPDKWYVQAVGRASYESLVQAGVRVYEYTPGFIHSKAILVDDTYAVVGTINMDYRSMYLHFECGVWLYDTPSLDDIKKDMLDTIKHHSMEITPEILGQVSVPRRLTRSLLRIFAPLM